MERTAIVPVKNSASQAHKLVGVLFGIEVVLTILVVFSVPILSERISSLYTGTKPLFLSMPWIIVFYLPSLFFVADSLVTKFSDGKLNRFYVFRHGIYVMLMISVFGVLARYMMITITAI